VRVLIGCEFSGIVRDAFTALGHYAVSCDILPSETPGLHFQGDVLDLIDLIQWDLGIFHPPCTHLSVSGARHFHLKKHKQARALAFVRKLMKAPFPYALENPVSVISSRIRQPDQWIQPWMFGHRETKKTGLWLKGLPLLKPTRILKPPFVARVHHEAPGPDRWKNRSRTYTGIARARWRLNGAV
jgi:hypothetical protein